MLGLTSFDPQQEYILEDERVLLRPVKEEDWSNFTNLPETSPEIWQYSLMAIQNKEDLKAYFQEAIISRKNGNSYAFIVFDKLTNEWVGCTRFYDIQLKSQSTQLGYTWYKSSVWGSGLNAHCKYLLLQFAFDQLGFERVEFRADNDNKRSIAAMQKIGCTIEGILRSHLPKPNGERRDSIVLSILKKEWQEKIKEDLLLQLK
jgi:RimJ/RimL family protein N-acetyltransferase